MSFTGLLYEYRWAIGIALVGLFLFSRYIMRRLHARREAERRVVAEPGDVHLVSPDGYRRARKQFLATLVLLVVIVVVAALTHLR